jgi:CRP-like cAMP-binding protein
LNVIDKKWLETSSTIQLPCNRSLISSYLGMSREVFSRNLKRLSHQGISVTKKTITITDKEKLCKSLIKSGLRHAVFTA